MIQSNDKLSNPCFNDEAGQYLEAAGFIRSDRKFINDAIYFFKDGVGVIIYNDNVDFVQQHDGEPGQRNGEFKRFQSFTGISALTLFDWMMLFHITKVVTMREFMNSVIKEGVHFSTADLLGDLFKHFQVTEDKNAIPLGY